MSRKRTKSGLSSYLPSWLGGSAVQSPHKSDGAYIGDHTHRDLRGGSLRAAVFGISDGLVSNVSLVLGTAGAHPAAGVVRLAGLVGLLGGSFSMAAGELISMQAQREGFERELEVERRELHLHPTGERKELELIYRQRGVEPEMAAKLAEAMMANPELALATHAREELGLDPDSLGSPIGAAVASFFSFGLGALLPLIPFLGGLDSTFDLMISILLTSVGALFVGLGLSFLTERGKIFSALRQLAICAAAGAVTFAIGSAVGATGR